MTRRLIALASIGLLAACTSSASTDDAAGTETDQQAESDGDGDAQIVIDDLADIQPECRDLLAGFLKDIEPAVERVDWDTATLADIQDLSPVIDQMTLRFETAMEATGCDDFAFGADDDRQFEVAVEDARQEAPASERWLRFSRDISTGLNTTADGETVDPSALPATCDEATAAVTDLIGDADTVIEILVTDLVEITKGIAAVEVVCTSEQAAAFLDDPGLQEFFGAG